MRAPRRQGFCGNFDFVRVLGAMDAQDRRGYIAILGEHLTQRAQLGYLATYGDQATVLITKGFSVLGRGSLGRSEQTHRKSSAPV